MNSMRSEINNFRIIIESSLRFLYSLIAFHEALANEEYVSAMNKNANFWRLFEASMLSSVFISIRRLYENESDSLNFQNFIRNCSSNLEEFNLQNVKNRKIISGALSIEEAERYIIGKYEPSKEDFAKLAKHVKNQSTNMKGAYINVASKVYAHAIHFTHSEALKPNQALNLYEIEKALLSVWHVYEQIWRLYENGRKPEYNESKYQYKDEVIESVIAQLKT
jgi:hypothetical protein